MKLSTLFSALLAAAATTLASSSHGERRTAIYVQPVTQHASAPVLLAEIKYHDPSVPAAASDEPLQHTATADAEITSFELPDLQSLFTSTSTADSGDSSRAPLLRVGAYSPSTRTWTSSTTLASAENLYGKGYAATIVLSLDERGGVLSAAVKGVRIDAGRTRDFGPRVVVRRGEMGRQLELGKPVVLTQDGRKPGQEEEKTFLQKYWWVLGIFMVLSLVGGGGGDK